MAALHNQRFQKLFGGTFLERFAVNRLADLQLLMLRQHKPAAVLEKLRSVRRERSSLQTGFESYILHSMAQAYSRMPGDLAEVGVFQGASAKLLCGVKADKPLHLFDTFGGLPDATCEDGPVHRAAQYACSLESVQEYLRDYQNVRYYPGLFPQSAAHLGEMQYCFVHIDVDLYESTVQALRYFYPRMAVGGAIVSHDYSLLAGVKTAFDEFFVDKPEPVFELPTTQCMVIKLPSAAHRRSHAESEGELVAATV